MGLNRHEPSAMTIDQYFSWCMTMYCTPMGNVTNMMSVVYWLIYYVRDTIWKATIGVYQANGSFLCQIKCFVLECEYMTFLSARNTTHMLQFLNAVLSSILKARFWTISNQASRRELSLHMIKDCMPSTLKILQFSIVMVAIYSV